MSENADVTTRDNPEAGQFEILVGDVVAGFTQYSVRDGVSTMPHTVVDKAFDGQGLGSKLAVFALDTLRERGLKVRPLCPFIKGYIERHEAYADLVV
ncbi:GNAT family N-acetyltransferase [Nocardioides sp. B-3]|uniref:GNAT family N-acetyltransferase n=1 Tax=Nocardioides sp. B-3 TaxID=2895565 RepID=UPI0021532705|nr:GNAT family N-acetyltransferase [Nocardioides sp. B-3]UUZ61064.1 N-acetyltransferase [Nocardioides sp. B-3]